MTTYEELTEIVHYLDRRFPDGNEIFQRVSRLAEETGELAQMVNHMEGMGIKHEKYGTPDKEKLAKEIQDVTRCFRNRETLRNRGCARAINPYRLQKNAKKDIMNL
jgi:hypothetical protein